MAAKEVMEHRRRFLKICSLKFCDIWQKFYFYRIFNNENSTVILLIMEEPVC